MIYRLDTCNTVLCVCVCARVCVHVAESSHGVAETTWEDSLSEFLEKEVQDTRKMVSALQVHAY